MDQKRLSLETGRRLKALREGRGLSLIALSSAIKDQYGVDISKDSLMNYEVSETNHSKAYKNNGMKVEYLRCFADFYHVTTDYLLGLSEVDSREPNVLQVCATTGLSGSAASILCDMQLLKESRKEKFTELALIGNLIEEVGDGLSLQNAVQYCTVRLTEEQQSNAALSFVDADNYNVNVTISSLLTAMRQFALDDLGAALDAIRERGQKEWAEYREEK